MKNRKTISLALSIVSIIISVILAITTTDVLDNIHFDVNKLILIASSVFTVCCVVLTTYLMAKRYKTCNVYISYTPSGAELAKKVAKALNNEVVVSSTALTPGTNLYSNLSKTISLSNVCFVVLCGKISAMQKEEIKIMTAKNKKIFTIVTPDSYEIPSRLKDIVPLQSTDSQLAEKIVAAVELIYK